MNREAIVRAMNEADASVHDWIGKPDGALCRTAAWATFGAVFMLAWNSALPAAVAALNDDTERLGEAGAAPAARGFLMALVVYTVMRMLFVLCCLWIMVYCGSSLVGLTTDDSIIWPKFMWRRTTQLLSSSTVVFESLALRHFPFHGLVLLVTIGMGVLMAAFYLRDPELADADVVRAKGLRILLCMLALMGCAYFVYGSYNIIQAALR